MKGSKKQPQGVWVLSCDLTDWEGEKLFGMKRVSCVNIEDGKDHTSVSASFSFLKAKNVIFLLTIFKRLLYSFRFFDIFFLLKLV